MYNRVKSWWAKGLEGAATSLITAMLVGIGFFLWSLVTEPLDTQDHIVTQLHNIDSTQREQGRDIALMRKDVAAIKINVEADDLNEAAYKEWQRGMEKRMDRYDYKSAYHPNPGTIQRTDQPWQQWAKLDAADPNRF